MDYLLVGIGSAAGGMARYGLGLAALRWWSGSFPWSTLLINILGSLLIGWFGAAASPDAVQWRLLVMVGLCGGFTTFSTFSLQTLLLIRHGNLPAAAINAALSVGACLAAAALGARLGA